MNEVELVGAFFVDIFASLCKACNFFGAYLFPENFIFSFEELTIFPVLALRMALILYSGFMVGSAARLISPLTICWSFGDNRTGVDTKLTDSIFS